MSSPEAGPVTRRLRGRAVTRPVERNRRRLQAAGAANLLNRVTGVTARPETQAALRFWPVTRPVTRLRDCPRHNRSGAHQQAVTLVTAGSPGLAGGPAFPTTPPPPPPSFCGGWGGAP